MLQPRDSLSTMNRTVVFNVGSSEQRQTQLSLVHLTEQRSTPGHSLHSPFGRLKCRQNILWFVQVEVSNGGPGVLPFEHSSAPSFHFHVPRARFIHRRSGRVDWIFSTTPHDSHLLDRDTDSTPKVDRVWNVIAVERILHLRSIRIGSSLIQV